jgi:hypothetical protein
MPDERTSFRLDRARRAGLGCFAPLLCIGAFAMTVPLLRGLTSGQGALLEVVGAVAALLLFSTFGAMLLILTVQEVPRAIRDDPVVVVGPAGLELSGVGLLPWHDIARLCVERHVGSDTGPYETGASLVEYRRLAIWPRDPSVARRRFLGRITTPLQAAIGSAPLGVFDYELERPLADVIELVRRFAPVEDCS